MYWHEIISDGRQKSFLNGTISEEVYVCQPPGFENELMSSYVFKLNKALYGLKHVPRAWYEKLSPFLIDNIFTRGKIDNTLFRKVIKDDFILVQMYLDDIIFGATN
uniref:Retrovirus-related Pol polyprotein from transposon TNT 1-94 n=1 Tax=Cajanus cajan TaxID=3821 RepID=A0A151SSA8_CAJCA|nr:Retrovirus-related Pol polyprotein from transposon TNT 1-94 [Cajanus cajan]